MLTVTMEVLALEVLSYSEGQGGRNFRTDEGWPYGTVFLWRKPQTEKWAFIPGASYHARAMGLRVSNAEGHIIVSYTRNLFSAYHDFTLKCKELEEKMILS